MKIQESQSAACGCLQRLACGDGVPEGVRLGTLLAKHTHPDMRAPDRLWHIDWESVLAEVILASARQNAVPA